MKARVHIKEELLKKGVEQVCIERGLRLIDGCEINDETILITDEDLNAKRQIVIFNDIKRAFLSKAKIKLFRDVDISELNKAIDKAILSQGYIQHKIKNSFIEIDSLKIKMGELTPRESALVERIVAGMSNREIAKDLYLSEKTVKNNLTELYRKLHIKNRIELTKKCKIILTENI